MMASPVTIEMALASQAIAWLDQEAGSMIPIGHLFDAVNHDPHQVLADMGEEHAKEQETKLQADIPTQLEIPDRFAQVVAGTYCFSYPDAQNLKLFEVIGLGTIVRFVEEDYNEPVKQHLAKNGIRSICIPVVPNKEGSVKTDVHCNQGNHWIGTVIGCFRKLQGRACDAIGVEYRGLAGKKARALDEAYIQAYKPGRGVRKTTMRLNVSAWAVAPDRLTESLSSEAQF